MNSSYPRRRSSPPAGGESHHWPFSFLVLLLGVVVSPALLAQAWRLVWNDEFDGSSIDSRRWQHETGGNGWGNNELQFYTSRPENSFVSDGRLHIRA